MFCKVLILFVWLARCESVLYVLFWLLRLNFSRVAYPDSLKPVCPMCWESRQPKCLCTVLLIIDVKP